MNAAADRSLLFDLPNWLGDVVLTLPAAQQLRDGLTHRVVSLVPAAYAGLVEAVGFPVVARLPGAGFGWARAHLRGRYDVALSARHSTRAKLLLRGAGAPRSLASRGRGARALGLETFEVDRSVHQRHDLDAALVRLGRRPVPEGNLLLELPRTLAEVGRRRVSALAGGAPVAAILPGTRTRAKRYPPEALREVGARLAAMGTSLVVVAGPGEGALAAEVAACGATVLDPALPLVEVAAVLAACSVAVGSDSGLTHVAAAFGCPTVALFGPTDPERTAPAGTAKVLRGTGSAFPAPEAVQTATAGVLLGGCAAG